MSNDENASKQSESDASPDGEPDHDVEEAPTADNPSAMAGPKDSFWVKKASIGCVSNNSN
jgi:hypothetical protein